MSWVGLEPTVSSTLVSVECAGLPPRTMTRTVCGDRTRDLLIENQVSYH